YRANVLANLGDGLAVEEKLQLLRRLCGREANELQSLLLQNEVQLGHAFAPIHIHRAQVRIVAHDFFDVVGDLAQLDGISPRHSVNVAFDDEVGLPCRSLVRSRRWAKRFSTWAKCFQGSANSAKRDIECPTILGQNTA